MEDIQSFIHQKKKKAKKVRGKHSPISELVENELRILKIKKIYNLTDVNNSYIFEAKNYSNSPKKRYFLVISLVSQSSDFLAGIAKKFCKNNEGIKLIQYCIFLDSFRINLLALKELKTVRDYENSIALLLELRKNFRKKLMSIIEQLQF